MLKGSFVPYFDHNATTPLTPGARDAWLHASDQAWQNPSSPYRDAARVRLDRLEALLAAGAIGAIAVMAANNETGVLPPWREIAARCRRHRAFYLCDASQWLGKEEPSSVLAAALAAIAAELPMASSPDAIQL